MKLNVGCGSNKIKGYINIDSLKQNKPDLVLDIVRDQFPYKKESVSEILFFHCIEHIQKKYHRKILLEFNRILKLDGKLLISFPEFWYCAKLWKENANGMREFWEATLYGRQLYPGDFHVCAMSTDELTELLYQCGFGDVESFQEPDEVFNTVVTCA